MIKKTIKVYYKISQYNIKIETTKCKLHILNLLLILNSFNKNKKVIKQKRITLKIKQKQEMKLLKLIFKKMNILNKLKYMNLKVLKF